METFGTTSRSVGGPLGLYLVMLRGSCGVGYWVGFLQGKCLNHLISLVRAGLLTGPLLLVFCGVLHPVGLREHKGCQGSNPSKLCVRQVVCLLYYCSNLALVRSDVPVIMFLYRRFIHQSWTEKLKKDWQRGPGKGMVIVAGCNIWMP